MITFKLEDKAAEAMMAVLTASNPNATFVAELKCQYDKQTAVEPEPEPEIEPETELEEE